MSPPFRWLLTRLGPDTGRAPAEYFRPVKSLDAATAIPEVKCLGIPGLYIRDKTNTVTEKLAEAAHDIVSMKDYLTHAAFIRIPEVKQYRAHIDLSPLITLLIRTDVYGMRGKNTPLDSFLNNDDNLHANLRYHARDPLDPSDLGIAIGFGLRREHQDYFAHVAMLALSTDTPRPFVFTSCFFWSYSHPEYSRQHVEILVNNPVFFAQPPVLLRMFLALFESRTARAPAMERQLDMSRFAYTLVTTYDLTQCLTADEIRYIVGNIRMHDVRRCESRLTPELVSFLESVCEARSSVSFKSVSQRIAATKKSMDMVRDIINRNARAKASAAGVSQTDPSQSAQSQSAQSQPEASQPEASQPAPSQPAPSQPGASQEPRARPPLPDFSQLSRSAPRSAAGLCGLPLFQTMSSAQAQAGAPPPSIDGVGGLVLPGYSARMALASQSDPRYDTVLEQLQAMEQKLAATRALLGGLWPTPDAVWNQLGPVLDRLVTLPGGAQCTINAVRAIEIRADLVKIQSHVEYVQTMALGGLTWIDGIVGNDTHVPALYDDTWLNTQIEMQLVPYVFETIDQHLAMMQRDLVSAEGICQKAMDTVTTAIAQMPNTKQAPSLGFAPIRAALREIIKGMASLHKLIGPNGMQGHAHGLRVILRTAIMSPRQDRSKILVPPPNPHVDSAPAPEEAGSSRDDALPSPKRARHGDGGPAP